MFAQITAQVSACICTPVCVRECDQVSSSSLFILALCGNTLTHRSNNLSFHCLQVSLLWPGNLCHTFLKEAWHPACKMLNISAQISILWNIERPNIRQNCFIMINNQLYLYSIFLTKVTKCFAEKKNRLKNKASLVWFVGPISMIFDLLSI